LKLTLIFISNITTGAKMIFYQTTSLKRYLVLFSSGSLALFSINGLVTIQHLKDEKSRILNTKTEWLLLTSIAIPIVMILNLRNNVSCISSTGKNILNIKTDFGTIVTEKKFVGLHGNTLKVNNRQFILQGAGFTANNQQQFLKFLNK
jgi:hypothetical protein